MSVHLSPSNTLGFNRPLTVLVKRTLSITNPNDQPVAFKVKTTAPKLYCVRPNSGRVEPGETVEVSVMLQALREEPPLNAKCKDKFLIQSTLLTPEKEAMPAQDIWSAPDGAPEEAKVYQQKLKVVYLPPEGQTLEEEDETQVNLNVPDVHPPPDVVRQPSQQQQPVLTNGHTIVEPVPQEPPRPSTPAADFLNAHEESHEISVEEKQPPVSVFVLPVAEPAPPMEHSRSLSPTPPSDELLIKYQDAQAEIERLRTLLAAAAPPPEIRRRSRRLSYDDNVTIPGSDIGTMVDEPVMQPEGVPLNIVVIISLGVFIMTYLFF